MFLYRRPLIFPGPIPSREGQNHPALMHRRPGPAGQPPVRYTGT